jgi:predicted nucleic acid-binding Zn ribbon protein
MECPNCGVYNPEDRKVCWRCDKPLPKPEPLKKRNPRRTSQVWLYIALAAAIVIPLLRFCGDAVPPG